jgi:hypothetical protein
MDANPQTLIAIHESAHCVCAALLHMPLSGAVEIGARTPDGPAGRMSLGGDRPPGDTPAGRRHDTRRIIVLFAGGLAERAWMRPFCRRESDFTPGWEADLDAIGRLEGGGFVTERTRHLKARARALVEENFEAITQFAERLLVTSPMTGALATKIIARLIGQQTR